MSPKEVMNAAIDDGRYPQGKYGIDQSSIANIKQDLELTYGLFQHCLADELFRQSNESASDKWENDTSTNFCKILLEEYDTRSRLLLP